MAKTTEKGEFLSLQDVVHGGTRLNEQLTLLLGESLTAKSGIALAFLLLATVLLAMGCANPSVLVLTNFGTEYRAVEPDSVRITTEMPTTPPYLEIGYIYLQDTHLDEVMRLSRKWAGEAGGEAIMNVRVGVNVKQVGNILTFPIYDRSYFVRGIVVRRKERQ